MIPVKIKKPSELKNAIKAKLAKRVGKGFKPPKIKVRAKKKKII